MIFFTANFLLSESYYSVGQIILNFPHQKIAAEYLDYSLVLLRSDHNKIARCSAIEIKLMSDRHPYATRTFTRWGRRSKNEMAKFPQLERE